MQTHAKEPSRDLFQLWGTVTEVGPVLIKLAGVSAFATVGSEIRIKTCHEPVLGEILSISDTEATAVVYSNHSSIRLGDVAFVDREATVEISNRWLGKVVDFNGAISAPSRQQHGYAPKRPLHAAPPPPDRRRGLGPPLPTGLMATDTLLPICQGQRVGLFAGSGVGKSTLLGKFARGIEADRIVIGLIGERSREVNEFVRKISDEDIVSKTVILGATASESPGAKKRAAYCAMAAAEHFRDQGHHTLLILDSLTRFAEAHREIALMCGEPPALNAFPPSTVRVIAELVERAGPGADDVGDITGIFSVLVAGSDMEEPVADMIRGILDGHIILSRPIAERGRFPAIDLSRSVSRALPDAVGHHQNDLIAEYKRLIALRLEVVPMLRASLYEFGKDLETDRAINLFQQLDEFAGSENQGDTEAAYHALELILRSSPNATSNKSDEPTEE